MHFYIRLRIHYTGDLYEISIKLLCLHLNWWLQFSLWPGLYLNRDYKESRLMAAFLQRFDLCIIWLLFSIEQRIQIFLHSIKSWMHVTYYRWLIWRMYVLDQYISKSLLFDLNAIGELSSSIYYGRRIWENLRSIFVYG